MAESGRINGSPASNGNYLYIEWAESDVNTANNTSKVTATVKMYNGYGSYSRTSCPWSVTINGTTTNGSISSFSEYESTVELGSASKTITHNSDGKKSITISAYFDTQGTSTGAVSASGTAVLSEIATGTTVTQSVDSKSTTAVTMKWTATNTVDHVWYSIDNGSNWVNVGSANAKTGSYTITGLTAGSTYKIKTRLRRKDTQIKSASSALSVTTYTVPTASQSLSSKTDKTIVMKWSSNQTVDYIWYSKDNGSTWTGVNVTDGKSGTYTIKSLSANTTYKIKTKIRAKASQATKETSALSVKTYPANYFTLTLTKKGSSTVSSFKVLATTSNTVDTSTAKDYSYKWTHYPSGKPKEAITANSNNVATCNSNITRTFSNLMPNTEYTVQAVLYKGTVSSGTVMFTKSITVSTADIGGTFDATVRTSSVINMALSGVATLSFPTRVKISYKNSKYTKWVLKKTVDIEASESKTASFMFTGLLANNTYNFKAELYKVDGTKTTLIKTYTKDVDTMVYVPDADEVIPSIADIINVPHACKALVRIGATEPLRPNTRIELLVSDDGETYTTHATFTEDLTTPVWCLTPISGTAGTSKYIRAVIKDANDIEHNATEPMEIEFKDLEWTVRERGGAVDIEADNVRDWANAMLELYRYDKTIGQTGTQGDIYDKDRFYNILLNLMDTLNEGLPIVGEKGSFINPQGSAIQVMEYLAVAFIEASTGEEWWAVDATSGTPIGAININSIFANLRTALETII